MYNMLKVLIQNKRYDKNTIKRKLDIYLLSNSITEEEYKDLNNMLIIYDNK